MQVLTDAVCIFFFQAEDGIRDTSVTGVQTCALPIYNGFGHANVEHFKNRKMAEFNRAMVETQSILLSKGLIRIA